MLEHLTVFINYAYHLYMALLEECNLEAFRGKWLKALRSLHGKINSALTQEPYSQTRARWDSQVGSSYSGNDNNEHASTAIFDGYGAGAIPSSITSMHHD